MYNECQDGKSALQEKEKSIFNEILNNSNWCKQSIIGSNSKQVGEDHQCSK